MRSFLRYNMNTITSHDLPAPPLPGRSSHNKYGKCLIPLQLPSDRYNGGRFPYISLKGGSSSEEPTLATVEVRSKQHTFFPGALVVGAP